MSEEVAPAVDGALASYERTLLRAQQQSWAWDEARASTEYCQQRQER